ncbi:30S ribosomal protein S18 [Mycoplasma sp. 128]|uniref:30S ribosomal protein S18 n=1 Tax=Mycoplasma sp. 3341 TaxID=3447506 RepID=UPI003F65BDFD
MARVVSKKPFVRRRPCQFCLSDHQYIDYKDRELVEKYVNQHGKILSSRITGTCARHQRNLATAIKRARLVALLPFIGSNKVNKK